MSTDSAVSKTTGDELVLVRQSGCLLFNYFSIGKQVSMDATYQELSKYAQKRGKSIEMMSYHMNDSALISLPIVPIVLPYIICTTEMQLSGVLK